MDSADLSDTKLKNGESRPSMDTEAVSGDEGSGGVGGVMEYEDTMFEEIKVDPSMLDPSCLVPPTIPGSLGAEDIDKVIAALTNVPDVRIPPPGSPIKRSGGAPPRRRSSPDPSIERSNTSKRQRSSSRDRDYRRDRDDDSDDYSSSHRRRRRRFSDEDFPLPLPGSLIRPMFRGRVFRGRVRLRARGARGVGRGLFISDRGGLIRGRGGFFDGGRGGIRPPLPVARGRNIFPAEEEARGGRGRGRFPPRENNLFKRFKQQHRGIGDKGEEEELYGDTKRWEDETVSSGSRSRSRSDDRSSSSSSFSSSDSDSDSKRKKKEKKKKHKKRKKKSEEKKKKKKRSKSSDSEEEEADGEGSGWRLQLLNRMKEIKKLPPEQLEIEFKKAMAEKRRKEEEEKCLEQIKLRQKLARKVKKEAERAARKAAKEARRKAKREEAEGGGENAFYAGFTAAMARGEEGLAGPMGGMGPSSPPPPIHVFKSSFAEVATESELQPGDESMDGQPDLPPLQPPEEEMDPYTRAWEESMKKMPKEEQEEVSWPAGALEEQEYEQQTELTREQVEMEQEMQEKQNFDRTKEVVTASKMFSKIRNRIRSKPLKINLKTSRPAHEEEPGLQPPAGENTPGELLSGEEGEETQTGYEEIWYDEDQTQYDMSIREEESEIVRRMERIRRRKERRMMLAGEEREDGEHSPSPEPERPHHRRRRKRRHEQKEGTPLLDEMANGGLEEGEIGNDTPTGGSAPVSWPPAYGPPPLRHIPPSPLSVTLRPPAVAGPIPFVDTSVPPPILGSGAYAPPPPHYPLTQPPPTSGYPPPRGAPPQIAPRYDPYTPAPAYPPLVPPAPPPPVPILNPDLAYGSHLSKPPPVVRPVGPMGDHADNKFSGRREERTFSRDHDRYERHYDEYGRRSEERYDRRSRYDEYGRELSRRSADRVDEYSSRKSRSRSYREDSDEEPASRSRDTHSVDITKITPLMKYIAKHLEESKYPLELRGPFSYRDDIPGLSKHLFVAYKMVNILQAAGLDQSKMYMKAMFPAGMEDTKKELIAKVHNCGLDPQIQGPKLVKMCVRCIKCFLSYFTGNKEDLESSEEDDDDEEDAELKNKSGSLVSTSLSAILGRIKEERIDAALQPAEADPLSRVLTNPIIPDTIDNHWGSMDTKIKAEHLRSFSALQGHFTKQLIGKGMDPRDAREESSDCMLCLVVTGWSDSMLRDMVTRFKKVILPEQSQLEATRTGSERTLFDQMVDLMMKHKKEFPLTILQQSRSDSGQQSAGILGKVRNIVERMLKFYMRGCGRQQEGRGDPTSATTASDKPNAPSDYQFNYLPEGLREDEQQQQSSRSSASDRRSTSNFFNMEAAAEANRSLSSYSKRLSVDENGDVDLDLEPVSPVDGNDIGAAVAKGALPKKKYLFGTMHVETLLYRGSTFVYEIGIYLSDSSALEVNIVPNNLYNQASVLEMLGFSFNPEDNKYIYVRSGGGGFAKTYSEEQGMERLMQFLTERRYESRGESRNAGLVLAAQSVDELATWDRFVKFHRKSAELSELVAGYGCLDLMLADPTSGCYVGPRLNREPTQTYFTWEYQRGGGIGDGEGVAATKAGALYRILEHLLGEEPDYENYARRHCFTSGDARFRELIRRDEIIKDLYHLEFYISDSLNERRERKKIYTEGIFSPGSTAELGDKAGFVAARFVRLLVWCGLSKPLLKDRALEARDRGQPFTLNMEPVLARMRKEDERIRCAEQIQRLTQLTEDYFLKK